MSPYALCCCRDGEKEIEEGIDTLSALNPRKEEEKHEQLKEAHNKQHFLLMRQAHAQRLHPAWRSRPKPLEFLDV